MSNRIVPSVAAFLAGCLLLAASSGCVLTSAVFILGGGKEADRPYFDDLASIDAAWAGDETLVIAFHGHLGRPSEHGERPPVPFDAPAAWWFAADISEFGGDAKTIGRLEDSPIAATLKRIPESRREKLASGFPPPDAILGMRKVPVLDVGRARTPESAHRAAFRIAARDGQVVYWPQPRSGSHSYFDEHLPIGFARADSNAREVLYSRVWLEKQGDGLTPKQKVAVLLLPIAMVVDLALLPVVVPAYLLWGIVATGSD